MKGTKNIIISNGRRIFELNLKENITVIVRNFEDNNLSLTNIGIRWMNWMKAYNNTKSPIKVTKDCELVFMNKQSDWKKLLKDYYNIDTVFIVDGACNFIANKDFIDMLISSGNYLVITSRSASLLKGYNQLMNHVYEFEISMQNNKLKSVLRKINYNLFGV